MSYAGVCGSHDVEPHNLPYFHAATLEQIGLFTTVGDGATCGTIINTSNNAPTVSGGADYVIPKSTPFALTAVGSDPNGDALTYNWEEMDSELSTQPPASTNPGGPTFRSFLAVPSPTRTFPQLSAILSNTTPMWEVLPSVGRNLNFRVTVRDIGAAYGCTGEDDVLITVDSAAGPFLVTAPNTNVTLAANNPQTVTWDVAGTSANSVNCANVRISLSTDGGLHFPTELAASTPNNGSATVTLPNLVSTTCRIKVEGVDNVFFDLSDTDFEIADLSSGTHVAASGQLAFTVLPNPTNGLVRIQLTAPRAAEAQCTVINLFGQILLNRLVNLSAGDNQVDLDIQAVPAGTYLVRLSASNQSGIVKVVKQ